MNNLISRQAALDIIDSELNGWLMDDERLHLEGVAIGIECLPRIDAVPVVRCKECKWWVERHPRLGVPWCRQMHIDREADGYCEMGEKRR